MKNAFDDDEMTADELRSAISGWNYHNALDKLEAAYEGACIGPTLMVDEAQRRSKSIKADWDRYDEMDYDDRESLQAYSDGLGEDMSEGTASLSLVREALSFPYSTSGRRGRRASAAPPHATRMPELTDEVGAAQREALPIPSRAYAKAYKSIREGTADYTDGELNATVGPIDPALIGTARPTLPPAAA